MGANRTREEARSRVGRTYAAFGLSGPGSVADYRARATLLPFLESFECGLEIVTDAPDYDWEFSASLPTIRAGGLGMSEITQPTRRRCRRQTPGKSCLIKSCWTTGFSRERTPTSKKHLMPL